MTRKAPWAKLTILRTPSTTRRPAATENRIDAVVAMSRTRENIAGQRLAEMDEAVGAGAAITRQRWPLFSEAAASCYGALNSCLILLQLGALLARADVLELLENFHAAVGLNLAEMHVERRVVLLVHLNYSPRALKAHLRKGLQDGICLDTTRLLDGRLVEINAVILGGCEIVRRLHVIAEHLLKAGDECLVLRVVQGRQVGLGNVDARGIGADRLRSALVDGEIAEQHLNA